MTGNHINAAASEAYRYRVKKLAPYAFATFTVAMALFADLELMPLGHRYAPFIFAVLVSYLRPLSGLWHAWQDSKSSQQTLAELQQENADLKQQTANDSTNAVVIREARRQGYIRTGERAFDVDHLPSN